MYILFSEYLNLLLSFCPILIKLHHTLAIDNACLAGKEVLKDKYCKSYVTL